MSKNDTSNENQGQDYKPPNNGLNGTVSNSTDAGNSTNVGNSPQNGTARESNVTGSCGPLNLNLTEQEAAEEESVEKKRIEEDEAKIAAFRK